MKNLFLTVVLLATAVTVKSQNPYPASPQAKRILYINGTVHTGNGDVIDKGAVGFEKGKLKLVSDVTTIRIDRTAYDTIIDITGMHVYPGLIALNTMIGLSEIEAVRATNDYTETGSLNPSVRAIVAYNTDSKVTPTVRSNGVLLAQIVPRGGIISGLSSVVELDAWNFEDAAYKTDEGMHLNWPSMRNTRTKDSEADEKQRKKTEQSIEEIRKLFSDAMAYSKTKVPERKNLHLEAMRGLFDGSKVLYVHCDFVKEIIAAAGMCREYGLRMVLVGGTDSWMVTDLLKSQDIPVVIVQTHRLPSREDEDVDMPYKLPFLLKEKGVKFAISVPNFWQVRNLPFQAGTAAGYGLTGEEALESITLSPAKIMGIDKSTGSLEEGKDATFIVTSGDLLDMKSSVVTDAYIEGRHIDLDNVQKQLNNKYRRKYGLN